MVTKTRWLLVLVFIPALVGCGGGTTSPAAPVSTAEPSLAPGTVTVTITAPVDATDVGFGEKKVSAPVDTPLAIRFANDDPGVLHNVQIFAGTDMTTPPVFAPPLDAMIAGVTATTYVLPTLPAGTYTYNCYAHPATMVGTLTVR